MKRTSTEEKGALAWAGCRKGNSTFFISSDTPELEKGIRNGSNKPAGASAERHSFLQYAMLHFRDNPIRENHSVTYGGSMRGTVKILGYLTGRRAKKSHLNDWTWKELTDKVKYSPFPIVTSLLKLENDYLNRLAVDTFTAIMRYMGDLPLGLLQKEVECVYTILVICHHHSPIRDEVYCQLMKQTTNNKSLNPESQIRGWRLLAFIAAFFKCTDSLMPYLMKYFDTAANDKRRAEQATAELCLHNLRQTIKCGGRRNVPTDAEVDGITEGKLSKLQAYYLPGGLQLSLLTTSSTVVDDIIKSICSEMGITNETEFREFSLYCIVEGDQYTMPLENDEYILDLVAELQRNENTFYLVFCRSVWNFELRLDSELYIEIIFHQIVPDYLEGFLLVMTCHSLSEKTMEILLKIALLLHRSKGNENEPSMTEIEHLLPKPALNICMQKEYLWKSSIPNLWESMIPLNKTEAKAQCLEILQRWSLFGSCFFGIKMLEEDIEEEYILAINKMGVNVLHMETHETQWRFNFAAVYAPYNVVDLNGTTYADVMFGDRNIKKTVRLQVDHAHEVTRLIQQYQLIQEMKEEKENEEINFPAVMIKV